MEKQPASNVKEFMIGLIAGGTIGGLTALLYAPKSGKELRKDIKRKSNETIDETKQQIKAAKKNLSRIMTDTRKKAEELVIDAKQKADSITKSTEKMISGGKEFLTGEAARFKEAVKAGVNTFNEESKK